MAYTVYILRDKKDKAYVGTTSTPLEVRWNNGNGYRFCEGLWESIQSDGWDSITKEVVAVGLTEEEASKREQELIVQLDTINPERGYNRELGGVGKLKKISDASREKMSKAHMGERNFNFGKHFTEEHRAKLSASNRGKKRSETQRILIGKMHEKPVVQYDLCGKMIAVFDSAKKAMAKTGIDRSHISKVCKHQQSTAGGFRWEFAQYNE